MVTIKPTYNMLTMKLTHNMLTMKPTYLRTKLKYLYLWILVLAAWPNAQWGTFTIRRRKLPMITLGNFAHWSRRTGVSTGRTWVVSKNNNSCSQCHLQGGGAFSYYYYLWIRAFLGLNIHYYDTKCKTLIKWRALLKLF